MFKHRFAVRKEGEEGGEGGGGGAGGAGVLADAAARAAAAKGGENAVKPEDARAYLTNFAPDPALLTGMQDPDVLAYHGRVKTFTEKAIADAVAAATAKPFERPEWLPEAFYDAKGKAPKLEPLAKAWKDTRAELDRLKGAGGKIPAKPEEYTLERPANLPAHILKDPANDADLKVLREVAHAAGMPQAMFEKFATGFFTKAGEMIAPPIDPVEEIKKLGENGPQVADTVFAWLDGKVADGTLSKDELAEVVATGSTATGMRALNKLREASGGAPIPLGTPVGANSYTQEELYAMVGTEKYQKDPAERARVDKLFEQHFGTQAAGTSAAGVGVR